MRHGTGVAQEQKFYRALSACDQYDPLPPIAISFPLERIR